MAYEKRQVMAGKCDRCRGDTIAVFHTTPGGVLLFTEGVTLVDERSFFHQFAHPDERIICSSCLRGDPRYRAWAAASP